MAQMADQLVDAGPVEAHVEPLRPDLPSDRLFARRLADDLVAVLSSRVTYLPSSFTLRMRDWIAAGNQGAVLDAVRDLRDSFGFTAAEEYGRLLKRGGRDVWATDGPRNGLKRLCG